MESIFLPGRIPSKKNSKVFNVKMKRLFSSKAHREWEKEMLAHLIACGAKKIPGVVFVYMRFNFPDMRKTDLSNKAESVMDLLVEAGVIEDDSWQVVQSLSLSGGCDKSCQAGCEVVIRMRGE